MRMETIEPWFVVTLLIAIATNCCCFSFALPTIGNNVHRKEVWGHWRQGLFAHTNDGQSDLCRQDNFVKNNFYNPITTERLFFDRRSFLRKSPSAVLGVSTLGILLRPRVAEAETLEVDDDGRLTDAIVQSLVFEKVLGNGSYKTVYLVSATLPGANNTTPRTFRYAMAVERLRNKRDVKNALRGVQIPGVIQKELNGDEKELFETIVDWWVQSSNVPDFEPGIQIFSGSTTRSRKEPKKNFAGSRYMVSLKPVYETDFKRFIQKSPMLYPVSEVSKEQTYWTEPVLLVFVLEILHAGKLMHEAGIVHRDIKPKNMMISLSSIKRPVIIDYGFSEFGDPLVLESSKKTDICVVRPGQLKGEVDYVLAEDLANYRGCQRGDTYAMGKTLFEFIFGATELQAKKGSDEVISMEGAEMRNRSFQSLLDNPMAGSKSRFRLSRDTAECLMVIIRGLCGLGARSALSFAEAEDILSAFVSKTLS